MCQFTPGQPDYILPEIVAKVPQLREYFDNVMRHIWGSIEQLLNMGTSFEFAQYLLPNAYALRFVESGDLLNLHHKWVQRLCYLAQEEIWRTCLEEVKQVRQVFPQLTEFIHAPCYLRVLTKDSPYCPEGNRYCGVRVWELKFEDFNRLI
jgi:thymidylate synthase ThyX